MILVEIFCVVVFVFGEWVGRFRNLLYYGKWFFNLSCVIGLIFCGLLKFVMVILICVFLNL